MFCYFLSTDEDCRCEGWGAMRDLRGVAFVGVAGMIALAAVAAPAKASKPGERRAEPQLINPDVVFPPNDYPVEALAARRDGGVRTRVSVAPDGTAKSCVIVVSSGTSSLDRETCLRLVARGRFAPARDEQGNSTAGSVEIPVEWRLFWQERAEVSNDESYNRLTIYIARNGKPTTCHFEAYWFGTLLRTEDCSKDPEVAKLVRKSSKALQLRGRVLVSENHIVFPGHKMPVEPSGDVFVVIRSLAEADILADGKVGNCRIISDNSDGAAGNPCFGLENSAMFNAPPPTDMLPARIRYVARLYSIPRDHRVQGKQ